MSLSVAFHGVARTEFIEASIWYESKRVGLGLEFIIEVDRCVSLASENPYQFAIACNKIRRVIVSRFPYSVYFRVEQDRIVILAVFHSSRNPAIWQTRA